MQTSLWWPFNRSEHLQPHVLWWSNTRKPHPRRFSLGAVSLGWAWDLEADPQPGAGILLCLGCCKSCARRGGSSQRGRLCLAAVHKAVQSRKQDRGAVSMLDCSQRHCTNVRRRGNGVVPPRSPGHQRCWHLINAPVKPARSTAPGQRCFALAGALSTAQRQDKATLYLGAPAHAPNHWRLKAFGTRHPGACQALPV